MNGLTRFVLKRPITTLMAVLCLIRFRLHFCNQHEPGKYPGYGNAGTDGYDHLFRSKP